MCYDILSFEADLGVVKYEGMQENGLCGLRLARLVTGLLGASSVESFVCFANNQDIK